MSRQQKKCLIATAGLHLLLIVILVAGPGFLSRPPKPDDTPLLDVIPATAVEAALNSGVKSAQPPPPAPILPPPPLATPPPKPAPPVPVEATPAPSLVQKVERLFQPEPPEPVLPTPGDTPRRTAHKPRHEHQIKVDLTTVQRTAAERSAAAAPDNSRAEERATAIQNAVRNLQDHFTPSTRVEMPGSSSVSYASYAAIIKSIYTRDWEPPDNAANDQANLKVRITVASDGTVLSARVLEPSGDASVDASVQRTLDRVTFIAPFPEGASEKQKTFIINFNLKAKRLLG